MLTPLMWRIFVVVRQTPVSPVVVTLTHCLKPAENLNRDTKSMTEKRKRNKNHISINGGNKSASTPHKICTMPTWLETWEIEDVDAVIGVVVLITVAYTVTNNCLYRLKGNYGIMCLLLIFCL